MLWRRNLQLTPLVNQDFLFQIETYWPISHHQVCRSCFSLQLQLILQSVPPFLPHPSKGPSSHTQVLVLFALTLLILLTHMFLLLGSPFQQQQLFWYPSVSFLPVHLAIWPYWLMRYISINKAEILEFKRLLGEISPVLTAEGVIRNNGEAVGWDTLMLVRYLIADTGLTGAISSCPPLCILWFKTSYCRVLTKDATI